MCPITPVFNCTRQTVIRQKSQSLAPVKNSARFFSPLMRNKQILQGPERILPFWATTPTSIDIVGQHVVREGDGTF